MLSFFLCNPFPYWPITGLQVLGVHYLAFIAKSMVSRSSQMHGNYDVTIAKEWSGTTLCLTGWSIIRISGFFFCPLFLLWPATKVSRNLSFRNIFLSFFSINLSFLKVYLVKSSSKSKIRGDGIQKSEFLGDFSLSYAPCLSFFRTWVFREVDKKKAWIKICFRFYVSREQCTHTRKRRAVVSKFTGIHKKRW